MKLSFIGDICLARQVGSKHKETNYQVVSQEVINFMKDSDYTIANLESPICVKADTDGDHLSFKGSKALLNQFVFIDYFSLSNNHINDCDTLGMFETINSLEELNIEHNGLYQTEYKPIIIEGKGEKIAIFTCTDMMNIPFLDDNPYKTLYIEDDYLNQLLKEYSDNNYFIILYAHVGTLFSRFLNPPIRNLLHEKIKYGADVIVTAHSHCVGGYELYEGKHIFHSLGDFVMDGGSYRRRESAILNLQIKNNKLQSYDLIPTITNNDLETVFPDIKRKKSILSSWDYVSNKTKKNSSNYEKFYRLQYKKELASHSISTLRFLLRTKGVKGMIKLIMQRREEVLRTGKWFVKDRSKDRRDDDAILKDRKRFSEDELFD